MTNPFGADPFGGGQSADDPFGAPTGGTGAFPKVFELYGKLLCLEGVKIEQVQKPVKFGGRPGEMIDRATVDTTVFDEDGTETTYDGMYWSQAAIIGEVRAAMKARRPVLGVLRIKANKLSPDKFTTDDAKARNLIASDPAMIAWLQAGNPDAKAPYNFTWYLADEATPAQKSRAIAWYQRTHNPFAGAAAA